MPFSLSPKQFLKNHNHPKADTHSDTDTNKNTIKQEYSSKQYHGHITSPEFSHPPSQLVKPISSPKLGEFKRPSSPLTKQPITLVDEITPEPEFITSESPSVNSLSSPTCYMNLNDINSFSSDSPKQPPAIITTPGNLSDSNGTTSPSSLSIPFKRPMSEKFKSSPSSFVRSSRIFTFENNSHNTLNSLSGKKLLLENKAQIENLPDEFHPILYLINAQKLRTYSIGTFEVLNENVWIEVDAKLTGNELTMWNSLNDSEQFKYINLIDFEIEVNNLQIKLYQDFVEDSCIYIRFESQVEFNQWVSAIILCKFEYIKLNEAYTAVVLSSKASKLSDTHILMSKKRYAKSDYCNIRLPQVSSKWLKVFMVILPCDNKHLGRIEIYKDDKNKTKKNLIALIASAKHVFNVYPELPNMIDFNSIMNLQGEIYINKNFENIFSHGKGIPIPESNSSTSLLFPSSSPKMAHSRSGSLNSTSSFFNNLGSPGTSPKPASNVAGRDRSMSDGSKFSSNSDEFTKEHKRSDSSFLKKHSNEFIMTDSIYIMPISHPGVSPIETMIRNFIPIIDSFKLYGRPQMLISDRKDSNSLLFGLPSLPRYQYLSKQQVDTAVAASFNLGKPLNWEKIIIDEIQKLQTNGFRGTGDIAHLYNSLDLNETPSPEVAAGYGFQDDLPSLRAPINLGDSPDGILQASPDRGPVTIEIV